VRPAHHDEPRRWRVLVLVVGVVVGLAVLARSAVSTAPVGPPPAPGAVVSPADAESSAWYCAGQSTAAGQLAVGSVDLTNTGTRTVVGSITSLTDQGAAVATPVSVPARGHIVAGAPASKGTWVSQAVLLSGGGVAVSQSVQGPSGWSEAPCQSSTSRQWYFPGGTTADSDDLYLALFNPTSTPDVVDLTFVTPSGVLHPIGFQGIVLQPQQTQVENVGTYVQNQSAVASTVTTRTGRVVASETQVFSGGTSGLANVPGSPRVEQQWSIPQSQEVAAGSSSIDIFNPGSRTEDVSVRTRLASAALPPFQDRVPPDSTWTLRTSAQTRIPKSGFGGAGNYTAFIDATGGAGVVVGRMVTAPSGAPLPPVGRARSGQCVHAGHARSGAGRRGPLQSEWPVRDVRRLRHDIQGGPRPHPGPVAALDLHLAERGRPFCRRAQSAAGQRQRVGGHQRERGTGGGLRGREHARHPSRRQHCELTPTGCAVATVAT
jgi:hypothetical protein